MEVAMDELRRSMRQEFTLNRTRFAPMTYLEAFDSSAFDQDDLATLYHENSKYVEGCMGLASRSVAAFESAEMVYTQAKIGPEDTGHERLELPDSRPIEGTSLEEAIDGRRSSNAFDETPVRLDELGTILSTAAGTTDTIQIDHEGFEAPVPKAVRAYPSAGALYPVETYLLVLRGDELRPGRYHYVPDEHVLRVLGRDEKIAAAAGQAFLGTSGEDAGMASVIIVLTGSFWRTMAKYGPRGYRYLLQESGHLAQNILLVAVALGLSALPVGGFYDDAVNELLGIDGCNEASIYAIAVGQRPENTGVVSDE